MSNQSKVNNINPLSGEEKFVEDNIHNNLSNVQNISNNLGINQKDNSSEQNLQNQFINNASNEDIIQKINSFLLQNKFTELSSFLNSNKKYNTTKYIIFIYIIYIRII